jgi:hypothetical protein
VHPGSARQLELLTVNREAKPPVQDLNYGGADRLVLCQFLAGVEAKDRHVHPFATVHNLRDHRTSLNAYFAGGIVDQQMGHENILIARRSFGPLTAGDPTDPGTICASRETLSFPSAERPKSGISTEIIIVSAIFAGLAIAAGAIIVTKVTIFMY